MAKKTKGPKFPKKENVGVLVVKLGRPHDMTTSRFHKLLHQVTNDCAKACNRGLTEWYIFRSSNPNWKQGDPYNAPPRRRKTKSKPQGNPPKDGVLGPLAFMSRTIYYAMCDTAPNLSTALVASCNRKLQKTLESKTSYKDRARGFKGRWRWESILLDESSLPNFRNTEFIPVPKRCTKLTYTEDECTIKFPLLSRSSGYRTKSPTVRLEVKDMTAGQRKLLRKLASGEIKLCDSMISFKPNGSRAKSDNGTYADGKWYVSLTFKLPTVGTNLDKSRTLVLEPCGGDDPRPFRAYWTDEESGKECHWDLGNGRPLVADYRRVQAKRRAIKMRPYRGHGCAVQAKRTVGASNYVKNLTDRFRKQTIADVLRLAARTNCGTILYREPTEPVRNNCWFSEYDMPMDWTAFDGHLAHRCIITGVDFDKQRIGMKEWLPRYVKKDKAS